MVPKFGDLEAAIMDVVWRAVEPVRVRDVADAVRNDRPPAFTTVQTVMDILYRKGWLGRAKEGRAYRYWALQEREDYTAQLLNEALDTSPQRAVAITRLFDQLDQDEIRELRQALDSATQHRETS